MNRYEQFDLVEIVDMIFVDIPLSLLLIPRVVCIIDHFYHLFGLNFLHKKTKISTTVELFYI